MFFSNKQIDAGIIPATSPQTPAFNFRIRISFSSRQQFAWRASREVLQRFSSDRIQFFHSFQPSGAMVFRVYQSKGNSSCPVGGLIALRALAARDRNWASGTSGIAIDRRASRALSRRSSRWARRCSRSFIVADVEFIFECLSYLGGFQWSGSSGNGQNIVVCQFQFLFFPGFRFPRWGYGILSSADFCALLFSQFYFFCHTLYLYRQNIL